MTISFAPISSLPISGGPQPKAAVNLGWFQSLAGPISQNIVPALAVALAASGFFGPPVFPQPNVVTVSVASWNRQFIDPVAPPRRCADFPAFTIGRPASDVTGISYLALSEPIRTLPRTAWFTPTTFGFAGPFPEEVSEDRWHQPWSEPVRAKPRAADFPLAVANILPIPAAFSDTRWFTPWSEPVRIAPRAVWFQPDTLGRPASDVTGIKYLPLSEPVRVPLRAAFFQDATSLNANPTISFSYYNWLTEPVRTPARAAWFQVQAYTESAPFPEEVSEDRWHQPWSEPVRFALRTVEFQAFATTFVITPPVTDLRYYQPWSEPIRVRPRLVWFDPSTRSLNPVVSFSYYQPLAEPIRTPARLLAGTQPFLLFAPNPVVSFSYFNWLSEPVRAKPNVVWQQFTTPPRPFIPIEPAGFRGWYAPWREPVRLLPRTVWFDPFTMPPRLIAAFTFGNMATIESGDVFLAGLYEFNRPVSEEVGIIVKPTTSGEIGLIEPTAVSANVGKVAAQPAAQSGAAVTPSSSAFVSIRVIR